MLRTLVLMSALATAVVTRASDVDLQRPPAPLPADMPKLSPLLTGTDLDAWKKQRENLHEQWVKFLGAFPKEKAALNAKILATEDLPDFTREHVTYQIESSVSTDAYLLTPKTPKPAGGFPAMVVFHPTVKTHAKEPAGIDTQRLERQHGPQLVARGYAVLCPRCFLFDEGADVPGNTAKVLARHPGSLGMQRMAYDAIRAVDYLETLANIDKTRIGCLGHSLGAKEVLYAAAFDERYKAAIFSDSGIALSMSNWDADWYLGKKIKEPGFALEHHQLIALIAPRGFLLLAGNSADNDKSWAFIEAALPIYKLFGASENIGWLNHGKGHTYPLEAQHAAEGFLERCLKPAR